MRTTPGPETAAPVLATRARLSMLSRPVRSVGWVVGLGALLMSISAAISLGAVPVPLATVWGVMLDRARRA